VKSILKRKDHLAGVKVFVPLGGAINYEISDLMRPPAWVTHWDLERLYRALQKLRLRWHRYFEQQLPFFHMLALQMFDWCRNPLPSKPEVG
jgi:N-acetylglucosaminyldiphosphoundecaprenol N-acetyl-beta-D-mannosaminyltransferase